LGAFREVNLHPASFRDLFHDNGSFVD
jgi:hypothetical protein